jgi:hypothetical protein
MCEWRFYVFNDLKDSNTETTALNFLCDKITQKAGFWFRLHRLVYASRFTPKSKVLPHLSVENLDL